MEASINSRRWAGANGQTVMSTSTSSLASALALIANPQTFTGVSKYSSDMQSILTRTQQIAQIPVTALQNDQTTLKSEVTALTGLQAAVSTLSTAISFLGSLATSGALTAASDNADTVSAAISGNGATAGTYIIGNVTSLASVSTATLEAPVADPAVTNIAPVDTNTLYLSVAGTRNPLVLTGQTNNLNGLRDAINSAKAGVTASILTTTDGSFLTLTATVAGASAITLTAASDGSGPDLLAMDKTGSLAQFEVNGKAATSTSNQVSNVIPGVALTLKALTVGTAKTTVSVSGNANALANALESVATAYNSLTTSIAAATAPSTGVLGGSQMVSAVRSLMRDVMFHKETGSVSSLLDLGVAFDRTGTMSVDASVLSSFTGGQLTNALTFIGNGTKGFSALSKTLDAYGDASTGMIQQSITQDQGAEQRLQDQIDAMNVRIQLAQKTTLAKLQAADTLLAMLTNQQGVLTSSIQSLNYTLYGVQTASTATAA